MLKTKRDHRRYLHRASGGLPDRGTRSGGASAASGRNPHPSPRFRTGEREESGNSPMKISYDGLGELVDLGGVSARKARERANGLRVEGAALDTDHAVH